MAIVTRIAKGSELLTSELDNNFSELDARTAIKWQNLNGEMVTDGIPNAPPMRLFNSTMYMRAFSADTEQEVSSVMHIPKEYIPGSDLYPHGHLVTPTASGGVVRWKLTISFANEQAVFTAPNTVYVEQTVLTTDTNKHLMIEMPTPLSIPTLEPDAIILLRVARDATHINDTYPDEIYMTQIDMYYQAQGFGESTR